MAEEKLQIVRLRTEFYRDGFLKVLFTLMMVLIAIGSLVALSLYLHFTKPQPVYFTTDNEMRVMAPVPLDKAYLNNADLLQWVGHALPVSFTYDFLNYQHEQQDVVQYYTPKGLQNLQGQLNNYHLDFNSLRNGKLFANSRLSSAPFILNQGILPEGKYAWKVQIPMIVSYSNGTDRSLVVVALVVRIPTLDNLYGVAIDDLNITEAQGSQVKTNG